MNMNDLLASMDTAVTVDAARVLAKLDAAGPGKRGLFIDCGSNLGQGFGQFAKHYPLQRFDYILIEPNPNCLPELKRQAQMRMERLGNSGARLEILEQAAGTRVGTVKFFGLEHDPTSQGGSMLKDHNNRYYEANEERALEVPTFSLAGLIQQRAPLYGAVALKLDIEGGEYEVLPHLISEGAHRLLDSAYIEFHSQYMAEPEHTRYQLLEDGIQARLHRDGVPYRIWI